MLTKLRHVSDQILLYLRQLVHVDCPFSIHAALHHVSELLLVWQGLPSLAHKSLAFFALFFRKHLLDYGHLLSAEKSVGG